MNPGLDGLYAQILERSKDTPHFLPVISTIALLGEPLPTSAIAEILDIHTYEVVNVLVDLQSIIQVPGTDDIPVTLCHTSLRDFLTTQSRSGQFFAPPRHHAHLYLRFLRGEFELRRRRPGMAIHMSERTLAMAYSRRYAIEHLTNGRRFLEQPETESAIRLCRETLRLHPDSPGLIQALADAIYWSAQANVAREDLEEAISLYRQALLLRPSADEDRYLSLYGLSVALMEYYHRNTEDLRDLEEIISLSREALKLRQSRSGRSDSLHNLAYMLRVRYQRCKAVVDLEEAITLDREGLDLRPSPHRDRSHSLNSLAVSLRHRFLRTDAMADLEEAISLGREALELRPSSHPNRLESLTLLSASLTDRYWRTRGMADLEEAISLHHEGLKLRPSPHPDRSNSLWNLFISLWCMYEATGVLSDLQESITSCEELLDSHYPVGHEYRVEPLNHLARLLQERFDVTGQEEDLVRIDALKEEGSRLSASTSTPSVYVYFRG
jgi:tetratricopeptide (TPR) repeat protein